MQWMLAKSHSRPPVVGEEQKGWHACIDLNSLNNPYIIPLQGVLTLAHITNPGQAGLFLSETTQKDLGLKPISIETQGERKVRGRGLDNSS